MRARVLTALALLPPVLAAVFNTNPWYIGILLVVLALLGVGEIVKLTGQILVAFGAPFVLIAAVAVGPYQYEMADWPHIAFSGLFVFATSLFVLPALKPPPAKSQVHALLGSGWVIGPLLAMFALHQYGNYDHDWHLPNPVLMAMLPLWVGDSAAIFVGKAIGKHQLAPKISPKKTVEGSLANLIGCLLSAWWLGAWIGIPLAQSLACGLAAGVMGQIGDLFESWMKRRANLKDSGSILPGHGGILDRIDSMLFTAPVVGMILLYWR